MDNKHYDLNDYPSDQQTVGGRVEPVVSSFELQLMWSEKYSSDMWWAVRVEGEEGRPDYYGPWFSKNTAQKFLDNELFE